jgi:Acetyltransferase (GNAT) domain
MQVKQAQRSHATVAGSGRVIPDQAQRAMVSGFIDTSDPRWMSALSNLEHDVYDLPEYVEVCGRYEGAKPVAYYATDGTQLCLIPLLFRPLPAHLGVPDDWKDAISPYGYSSALFRGDLEWTFGAIRAFVETCRDNHVVSVFIRLNPLIPLAAETRTIIGDRVTHGSTVAVDLSLSEEELRRQTRESHRRSIARLLRNDFTSDIDRWSEYDNFVTLYQETMQRRGAIGYYRFRPDYFHNLKAALGTRLHLVSIFAPGGELAAGGLFTQLNGIVQYHLGGTSGAYLNFAPAKLMLTAAIADAKEAGNRVLHLGGGVGGKEDDLFRFKCGYSTKRFVFETWRIVTDTSKFEELVSRSSGVPHEAGSFFPAYRTLA